LLATSVRQRSLSSNKVEGFQSTFQRCWYTLTPAHHMPPVAGHTSPFRQLPSAGHGPQLTLQSQLSTRTSNTGTANVISQGSNSNQTQKKRQPFCCCCWRCAVP
jgi:hypothetical protein